MAKQQFGGDWTEDKLSRVKEYFERYNIALKNQRFIREYIDAFAGTGYREPRSEEIDADYLFPELAEPEVRGFLEGSARIALKVDPGFARFTFILHFPRKPIGEQAPADEISPPHLRGRKLPQPWSVR